MKVLIQLVPEPYYCVFPRQAMVFWQINTSNKHILHSFANSFLILYIIFNLWFCHFGVQSSLIAPDNFYATAASRIGHFKYTEYQILNISKWHVTRDNADTFNSPSHIISAKDLFYGIHRLHTCRPIAWHPDILCFRLQCSQERLVVSLSLARTFIWIYSTIFLLPGSTIYYCV